MSLINPLDEAELRLEMRRLYREKGLEVAIQCLYEMLAGARILAEVISEEEKERRVES